MLLTASNLIKKIGAKTIVDQVSFSMQAGEAVALFGPNGAGKSTLLKLIATLSKPSSGQVLLLGEDLYGEGARGKQKIGLIAHPTLLYEHLTALENLRFYGEMYGVTKLSQRIEDVLRQVGLEFYAHEPVGTYSRGMQQRLAIARAILPEPQLLLLDEPYTGLDQQSAEILNQVIKQTKARGAGVLLVSHNFEEGLKFSDRLIILVRGKVAHQQPVEGLSAVEARSLYEQVTSGGGKHALS